MEREGNGVMASKRLGVKRIVILTVAVVFFVNCTTYGSILPEDKLTPSVISQTYPPTEESAEFREEVMSDMKFMSVAFSIAQHFIEDKGEEDLSRALIEKFQYTESFLEEQFIDLGSATEADFNKDGIIKLRFISKDGNESGIIGMCSREKGELYRLSDDRWEIVGRYAFFVEKVTNDDSERAQTNESEEDMIADGDNLLTQLYKTDPDLYVIRNITNSVMAGETRKAAEKFFTSGIFQDREEDLKVIADLFNSLIRVGESTSFRGVNIRAFAAKLITNTVKYSENPQIAQSAQLIAGQALTVISWQEREVPKAIDMQVTADVDKMAENGKRGKSFLAVPAGRGVKETDTEGNIGFYWRGIEGTKKLGENAIESSMYDKDAFNEKKDNLVMYLMDHGFTAPTAGLEKALREKRVSTIHETRFLNDFLPGSRQTTSTGAGHFQGTKLDVKNVTEGEGIQVNVRYNIDGTIEEVFLQSVVSGDWCFALPGCVDYMINLGGLAFNDVSIDLTLSEASAFNPKFNFSQQNLSKMSDVTGEAKFAPFIAEENEGNIRIFQNPKVSGNVAYRWLPAVEGSSVAGDMLDFYQNMTWKNLGEFIDLAAGHYMQSMSDSYEKDIGDVSYIFVAEPPLLSKTEGIKTYIDDSREFVKEYLENKDAKDKLIRVPLEHIEKIGVENVRGFLEAFQATSHGYIELYSLERPEGVSDPYGLVTKPLSDNLKVGERTRANTVTVFLVSKGEELPGGKNKRWGFEDPTASIIAPVGLSCDKAGLVRSLLLGLRLSVIAGDSSMNAENSFVSETLDAYRTLCLGQGTEPGEFDLTASDLVNIARGAAGEVAGSLNRLIKLLPIMPIDTEELRELYKHAREALIRA